MSLRQAFAHCGRFLAAASRRSLGRVSVPVWPITLSGRLLIVALVSHYLTNKLISRRLLYMRYRNTFIIYSPLYITYPALPNVSTGYSSHIGRLPTCYSPVRHSLFVASNKNTVRLACLKRTASVRSEPGSNSP